MRQNKEVAQNAGYVGKMDKRILRLDSQNSKDSTQSTLKQGTMPGARRRGRPRTAWMDNIKTWTGQEESIRMTAAAAAAEVRRVRR